jgi:hypothetical protein
MQTLKSRLRTTAVVAVAAIAIPVAVVSASQRLVGGTTLTPTGPAPTAQLGTGTVAGSAGAATGSSTSTGTATGATTTSGNLPADKVTVGGSKIEVFSPNTDVTLLAAQMRTSNVADLTFAVSLECSIVTSVTTMGNDMQSAFGQVRVWVEIDGKDVGVVPATQGQSDDGHVVFCNRTYSSTTNGFSEAGSGNSSPTITTYQATKNADEFNWVAMNVGNGIHTISVHAELTTHVTDASKDMAQAVVGDRTVVVDTTQTAQNTAS